MSEESLNKKELAAMSLRVPASGTEWLDDMIREARRLDCSETAMAAMLAAPHGKFKARHGAGLATEAFDMAYQMRKESEK